MGSVEKRICCVFVFVSVSVRVSVSVCDCVPLSGKVLNHLHASACSPPKRLQTGQSLVTCRHHLPDSVLSRSKHVGTLRHKIIVSLSCYIYACLHMGGNLLTVQSMKMMSYFLFFLATVFGNLEVWKVRK